MQELMMKLIDVNVEEMLIKLVFRTEVEGDEFELEKSIRLSVWDEAEKKLVADEDAHAKGMATVERIFGITDIADFANLLDEEYNFFMSEEGQIFFEEPEWYAEKKELDALWENVVKPDPKLKDKQSKGTIEHVQITKNGVTIFFEVTGKAGNGLHVVTNFRFGSYNADGDFKRQYKKKISQESTIKTIFDINAVEDLKDLVGEVAVIKFEEAPNKAMFTSCSGLDE